MCDFFLGVNHKKVRMRDGNATEPFGGSHANVEAMEKKLTRLEATANMDVLIHQLRSVGSEYQGRWREHLGNLLYDLFPNESCTGEHNLQEIEFTETDMSDALRAAAEMVEEEMKKKGKDGPDPNLPTNEKWGGASCSDLEVSMSRAGFERWHQDGGPEGNTHGYCTIIWNHFDPPDPGAGTHLMWEKVEKTTTLGDLVVDANNTRRDPSTDLITQLKHNHLYLGNLSRPYGVMHKSAPLTTLLSLRRRIFFTIDSLFAPPLGDEPGFVRMAEEEAQMAAHDVRKAKMATANAAAATERARNVRKDQLRARASSEQIQTCQIL